ncbi:MAG: S1C family serine protease [Desulforhopalus sp.]
MRCPKCDHIQENRQECEFCGVIFEKYRQVEERKKALQDGGTDGSKSTGRVAKILQTLLLVVVVAASTYYFTGYRNGNRVDLKTPAASKAPVGQVEKRDGGQPVEAAVVPPPAEQPAAMGLNVIEQAKNSTVSIETPWGTGSGFFVNKYYIVTNRHVIEFDEEKLAEFKARVETARRMIELERQKIAEMKRQLQQMPQGPSRSQLALIINTREKELQKVLPRHREGEERLERLEEKVQPSDIKIVLADGSEHVANYLIVSDNRDLALMSLFSGEWPFIERPPETMPLHQGDKVFTIGSPVGLRHTVTAGIFSGYRRQEENGSVYLQTDAPINPGNSGGPLIDEHGYVRGVNTMILRDTEGIGFAIPIEQVFEEFSATLY